MVKKSSKKSMKRNKSVKKNKSKQKSRRQRTRSQKKYNQKGGSSVNTMFPELNLMVQNAGDKISNIQSSIQGTHAEVSGKPWIQPLLSK